MMHASVTATVAAHTRSRNHLGAARSPRSTVAVISRSIRATSAAVAASMSTMVGRVTRRDHSQANATPVSILAGGRWEPVESAAGAVVGAEQLHLAWHVQGAGRWVTPTAVAVALDTTASTAAPSWADLLTDGAPGVHPGPDVAGPYLKKSYKSG